MIILDSGNPAYSASNPLATPYEYQPITSISGNVLTINSGTRGNYAGTTPHAYFAGATVAAIMLAESLTPNTGAVARIDKAAGALQLGGLAGSAGPPTTGTWAAGDEYEDSGGTVWVCIVAGTPGTWRRVDGWFGIGSPRVGSGGTLNNRIIVQAGSNVVTTNSNGDATISFPAAFPNGVFALLTVPGDLTSSSGFFVCNGTVLATSFGVRCFATNGTAINTLAVRCDWIAIGW